MCYQRISTGPDALQLILMVATLTMSVGLIVQVSAQARSDKEQESESAPLLPWLRGGGLDKLKTAQGIKPVDKPAWDSTIFGAKCRETVIDGKPSKRCDPKSAEPDSTRPQLPPNPCPRSICGPGVGFEGGVFFTDKSAALLKFLHSEGNEGADPGRGLGPTK